MHDRGNVETEKFLKMEVGTENSKISKIRNKCKNYVKFIRNSSCSVIEVSEATICEMWLVVF